MLVQNMIHTQHSIRTRYNTSEDYSQEANLLPVRVTSRVPHEIWSHREILPLVRQPHYV